MHLLIPFFISLLAGILFALMQKASYEKHEGMGMLCGFYRTEGMLMDYAGATPLAFTDTRIYYMTEPTDVNYDYEDEEIAREYKAGGRVSEDLDQDGRAETIIIWGAYPDFRLSSRQGAAGLPWATM